MYYKMQHNIWDTKQAGQQMYEAHVNIHVVNPWPYGISRGLDGLVDTKHLLQELALCFLSTVDLLHPH